jgi:hypothetical protein
LKPNELLQKALVKQIKKRNKYNASLRTSNNQFAKSNSQYLNKGQYGKAEENVNVVSDPTICSIN